LSSCFKEGGGPGWCSEGPAVGKVEGCWRARFPASAARIEEATEINLLFLELYCEACMLAEVTQSMINDNTCLKTTYE